MTNKIFIVIVAAHWLVSVGGFLGVNVWAQAAADAGRMPAALARIGRVVHFVLLQPLAHWLLAALEPRWWTWPGLLGLAAVLIVNSVAFVVILALARRVIGLRVIGRRV